MGEPGSGEGISIFSVLKRVRGKDVSGSCIKLNVQELDNNQLNESLCSCNGF